MGVLSFQIKYIPDLSLNKYQSLADTGIQGVLKRHENFIRQWHGICNESNTNFHLLYCYLPDFTLGERLKIYIILQGCTENLDMITPLLQKSPLSDFYKFEIAKLPEIVFNAGATFTKKERIAELFNPLTSQVKSVHYVPSWELNESGRLYDLFKVMETISESYYPNHACAFRINVFPTNAVLETRNVFNPILKELRGENDIKLVKDSNSNKSNNYAKDVCKIYEDWLTKIETMPHFRVNIYSFAENPFKAKLILNAVGSEAINEGDFSIANIKADVNGKFNLLSRMTSGASDYSFYPSQAILKSWATTYSLNEIIPFFRLPVLYEGEVIEIPKESVPIQDADGIILGEDKNGFPVTFHLKDFTRHAFFTGMPGSGKTNTMLHIATQLHKNKVPFLALEPAKKEYRALLGYQEMHDVYLFSPHIRSSFPLCMNPLEFPKDVQLSEHINALLEVFEGTFMLEGPTYKFLSSSIQRAYSDLGWDLEDINEEGNEKSFPRLSNIYDNLQKEIDTSSYDSELKGNVRAFLQVRLGGLMERDAGELFNVSISTLRPEEWLKVSAIVELEALGEQAKNFFVLTICHYILESLRADPMGGINEDGKKMLLRHVVFIEEAHNIIASSSQQDSTDSVNHKISATAYIVKMLAEVRALREGIIIADQLPTALTSEVIKNTGLKIVHRLTSEDDRKQIGSTINASSLQLEQMASFSSGKALIYHEKTMKPFEIQIKEWLPPKLNIDLSNDQVLYQHLSENENVLNSIAAYLHNWQDKYIFPMTMNSDLLSLVEKAEKDYEFEYILIKEKLVIQDYYKLERKWLSFGRLWKLTNGLNPFNSEFNAIIDFIKNRREEVKENCKIIEKYLKNL